MPQRRDETSTGSEVSRRLAQGLGSSTTEPSSTTERSSAAEATRFWTTRHVAAGWDAADEVTTTLFRALALVRLVVLLYAVALNATRWREFDHPVVGWVVVAGLVAWTGFATWAYDEPRRRGWPLYAADVAVAAAAILITPYVHSDEMLGEHVSTMPSFWVMAAVLACAVGRGWVVGVGAAVLISTCDLAIRPATTTVLGNIFLLLLAAAIVGYSTSQLRIATAARAHAERVAATMQERARLARVVHDGVLQVLALVQRRGREIGGPVAELGSMAGEQEVKLRALVQGDAAAAGRAASPDEAVDLLDALVPLASRTTTITGPGTPVPLPAAAAEELASVVRACLDNVARHVGEDAPAWVLVEDLGDSVAVSVRDDGPGIAEGRLEQAAAEGRLGVSQSVCGRMADLGGTATLVTAPGQGTEWELVVPR